MTSVQLELRGRSILKAEVGRWWQPRAGVGSQLCCQFPVSTFLWLVSWHLMLFFALTMFIFKLIVGVSCCEVSNGTEVSAVLTKC